MCNAAVLALTVSDVLSAKIYEWLVESAIKYIFRTATKAAQHLDFV